MEIAIATKPRRINPQSSMTKPAIFLFIGFLSGDVLYFQESTDIGSFLVCYILQYFLLSFSIAQEHKKIQIDEKQ